MKYCNTCKISYHTPLSKCMFCNNELTPSDKLLEINYYPPVSKERNTKNFTLKLIFILLLISNIICLFIDISFNKVTNLSWSLYVLSSSTFFYVWIRTISSVYPAVKKVLILLFIIILELLSIGFIHGNYHWASDYILPFGIIATTLIMSCFLFGKRAKLYDNLVYVLLASSLFLIPLILYFMGALRTAWPSFACIGYCIITLFTLTYFRSNDIKNELLRRFHL